MTGHFNMQCRSLNFPMKWRVSQSPGRRCRNAVLRWICIWVNRQSAMSTVNSDGPLQPMNCGISLQDPTFKYARDVIYINMLMQTDGHVNKFRSIQMPISGDEWRMGRPTQTLATPVVAINYLLCLDRFGGRSLMARRWAIDCCDSHGLLPKKMLIKMNANNAGEIF